MQSRPLVILLVVLLLTVTGCSIVDAKHGGKPGSSNPSSPSETDPTASSNPHSSTYPSGADPATSSNPHSSTYRSGSQYSGGSSSTDGTSDNFANASSDILAPSPSPPPTVAVAVTTLPTSTPESASAPSLVATMCTPVIGFLIVLFW